MAYNAAQSLDALLGDLLSQTIAPEHLEALLVDSASTDDTAQIMRRFAARAPFEVKLLENPKRWLASGINFIFIGAGLRNIPEELYESAAIDGAAARGCASPEALTARAEYLLEQAVPEPIILRVFAEMFSLPEYPELVPDPPVRYVQADSFGALTRCLAYRLSGMHLRLVGSKGCGKNTLIQTVDWLLNVPQYRMQGNAELDKLDLLGGPTIENGTMRYRLSDMLRYLAAGADVVLDEGNTIKPECADVLHSLTDAARQIQVPGYGLVQMHPHSAFTITMNEDYAGTNFMNEATIDRFTPIHIAEPESIVDVLHRVVPEASAASLNICDYVYCAIRDRIRSAGGLEPDAMTIRGFIDALRAEPLLGLRWGLLDNVASKPQDAYTRLQLTELIESMVPQDGRI